MFTFLLVLQAIVATALVAVILMQRSEGGGLGMGGSPSGLMSARGAADFLTRATTILATIFIIMSIGLAAYAGVQRAQRPIDTSLARPGGVAGGVTPPAPTDSVPLGGDPLAGAAAGSAPAPGNAAGAVLPTTPAPTIEPAPAARGTSESRTATERQSTDRPAADRAPRTAGPSVASPAADAPATSRANATPRPNSPAPATPATTTRSTAPTSNPTTPLPAPKADSTPAPAPAASGSTVPLAQ